MVDLGKSRGGRRIWQEKPITAGKRPPAKKEPFEAVAPAKRTPAVVALGIKGGIKRHGSS